MHADFLPFPRSSRISLLNLCNFKQPSRTKGLRASPRCWGLGLKFQSFIHGRPYMSVEEPNCECLGSTVTG